MYKKILKNDIIEVQNEDLEVNKNIVRELSGKDYCNDIFSSDCSFESSEES